MNKHFYSTLFLLVCSVAIFAASPTIRLNYAGFYPEATKIAVVLTDKPEPFYLISMEKFDTVLTGTLEPPRKSLYSNRIIRTANFSSITKPGWYVLFVGGNDSTYPFQIKRNVYESVAIASMKAFYFQRASTALAKEYAGIWSRAKGHPDKKVVIHASAASPKRPIGTMISAPGGWYDAGDYNKYIVNSGITMGTLLSLYEDFPEYVNSVSLNIPESKNSVPDVLDEALWNLRWMLSMQDPNDGGVYHKCTNAGFDGMVMPDVTKEPRYVVQKGTAAALDFAAVMAQASRVYGKFDKALPGLKDSCLTAAVKAWSWAQKNPKVIYDQDSINMKFKPRITTGAYDDTDFSDEFIWAASELYLTTQQESYYQAVNMFPDENMPLPSWAQVRLLGYYSLLRFENQLTPLVKNDLYELKRRLTQSAEKMIKGVPNTQYQAVMGQSKEDFVWGSNAVAANQSIFLIQAYKLTKDKKYLSNALTNVDYILGRNATGYSFVTGFGYPKPMHPHHRPSEADGINDPIPGLLVGGPNPGMQDKCEYPSKFTDEAYVDSVCSYASNEIAINWNAPLVYLLFAMEALQ